MTVSELIAILSRFDPDLPVEMGMNEEYQCRIEPHMVVIEEYDGARYVCINDCAVEDRNWFIHR